MAVAVAVVIVLEVRPRLLQLGPTLDAGLGEGLVAPGAVGRGLPDLQEVDDDSPRRRGRGRAPMREVWRERERNEVSAGALAVWLRRQSGRQWHQWGRVVAAAARAERWWGNGPMG